MKKTVITFLLLAIGTMCIAQETTRWNTLHLGYGIMQNTPSTLLSDDMGCMPFEELPYYSGSVHLEWSRQINAWLEAGLYLAVKEGGLLHHDADTSLAAMGGVVLYTADAYSTRFPAPGFGITARVHMLPLAGAAPGAWDVYAVGNIGGWLCNSVRKEYGLGMGVSWFPTRHFGLYGEWLGGSYKCAFSGHLHASDGILKVGMKMRF